MIVGEKRHDAFPSIFGVPKLRLSSRDDLPEELQAFAEARDNQKQRCGTIPVVASQAEAFMTTEKGLLQRLKSSGPKRILSLDGGGIRGILIVSFLQRIESLLRDRLGRPDLRLRDYFDLIGGTSTGSILAAGLAIGLEAAQLREYYIRLGGKVFGKKRWNKLKAAYDEKPLMSELENVLHDRKLGDPEITTGLCIIAKRADTNSTWPLINHPDGKYFERNRNLRLVDVVRASTAAPTYFIPQLLDIGHGKKGAFVDGGVSMAKNPALTLFFAATLQGFPFHWQLGADRLLLTSIGTGTWSRRGKPQQVVKRWLINWAEELPRMLMDDADTEVQLVLQCLSQSLTPWQIDREIGDLRDDLITPHPALTYLRYDVKLEKQELEDLGLPELSGKVRSLRNMSAGNNRYDLARIGDCAAERYLDGHHFPTVFDTLT